MLTVHRTVDGEMSSVKMHLSQLPDELLTNILSYLPYNDLCQLALVSRFLLSTRSQTRLIDLQSLLVIRTTIKNTIFSLGRPSQTTDKLIRKHQTSTTISSLLTIISIVQINIRYVRHMPAKLVSKVGSKTVC